MPRQRDPEPDPAGSRPTKVVLEPEAAAELADLLADAPGEADEDVLDDALDALRDRTTRIPGHQQREVGAGELVAIQIEDREATAAIDLIENDEVTDDRMLRGLGERLRGRLQRARSRRRSR